MSISKGGRIAPTHRLSKHILNRNNKSEHITHLDNVFGLSWFDPAEVNSAGLRAAWRGRRRPSLFGRVALRPSLLQPGQGLG